MSKRVNDREYRLARRAANPGRLCPPDHRHGATSTCYNGHGCLCDDCRQSRQRIRTRETRNARILRGEGVLVSSVGARRRLESLAWMGWSSTVLAERYGTHYRPLLKIRGGERERVRSSMHKLIVRMFDELAMVEVPDTHSARVTSGYARRNGWSPPLAWANIDDPTETPEGVVWTR